MNLKLLLIKVQQRLKPILSIILFSIVFLSINANALDRASPTLPSWSDAAEHTESSQLRSVIEPVKWAKRNLDRVRSKGDVKKQVKQRYEDAEVLKIWLNKSGDSYNVKLLSRGKIRIIQVNSSR